MILHQKDWQLLSGASKDPADCISRCHHDEMAAQDNESICDYSISGATISIVDAIIESYIGVSRTTCGSHQEIT